MFHMITEEDFSMEYPSKNRINRIASEIQEYLNYKRKMQQHREDE